MIVYHSITVEENKTNILAVPKVKIKVENEKRRKETKLEKLKEQRKIYKKVKF